MSDLEPLWERLNARAQQWSDQPNCHPPLTGSRKAILDALMMKNGEPMTVVQLMAATNRSKFAIYNAVRRLEAVGDVTVTDGYRLLIRMAR